MERRFNPIVSVLILFLFLFLSGCTNTGITFTDVNFTTVITNINESLWNQSGDDIFFNTGNVGIGTETPTEFLHVSGGDFRMVGDIKTDQWLNNASNTFLGVDVAGSGNLAHTGGVEGFQNTAVGFTALEDITIGRGNTAFGQRALRDITTGNLNTALGESSMLRLNTGSNNLAVGSGAMFTITSANGNTAIGANALSALTTGGSNVVVGATALGTLTTGANNVAFGNNAGRFVASGGVHQTGGGSVFLGEGTRAMNDSQTNQIVIGFNAIGIGTNTVTLGNDDIVTTALKGDVGIETESPQARLEVQTSAATVGLIIQGDAAQSADLTQWTNNTGGVLNVVDSDGNVGIGDTSPSFKLDVNSGTDDLIARFISSDSGASIGFQDDSTSDNSQVRIGALGNDMRLIAGGSARVRIKSGGNVGIGLANPQRILHISDTLRIEPRTTAPTSPSLGDIYVDSTTNTLCFYNSTDWISAANDGVCA